MGTTFPHFHGGYLVTLSSIYTSLWKKIVQMYAEHQLGVISKSETKVFGLFGTWNLNERTWLGVPYFLCPHPQVLLQSSSLFLRCYRKIYDCPNTAIFLPSPRSSIPTTNVTGLRTCDTDNPAFRYSILQNKFQHFQALSGTDSRTVNDLVCGCFRWLLTRRSLDCEVFVFFFCLFSMTFQAWKILGKNQRLNDKKPALHAGVFQQGYQYDQDNDSTE